MDKDIWLDARVGKFTGSQIHKLLGIKGLGETGKTYAFENAAEIVFGRNQDEGLITFDMQRGLNLEPFAFNKFKSMSIWDVEKCSFFAYENNAGASPDGLVGTNAVLEIKCPRSAKFFNLVAKGYDAIDKEYIAQMQMEMLVTNSNQAHFFNYIIFNSIEMWHEIIVLRDEVMIDLIKSRILEAVAIRDNFVIELNKNKQF